MGVLFILHDMNDALDYLSEGDSDLFLIHWLLCVGSRSSLT